MSSDTDKSANRIPVETIKDNYEVVTWSLPNISKDGKVVPSAASEARKKKTEKVENVSVPSQPKPLTAQELEKIAKDAYDEAYKEGREEGFTQGLEDGKKKAYVDTKKTIEDERSNLQSIAQTLLAPLAQQQQELENIVVDMAVQIAKHILSQEIVTDPSVLYPVVTKALSALPAGAKNIKVHLNIDDAELFTSTCADINDEWTIIGDPQIASGGCKVETTESLVDYSVESRLQQYIEEIRQQGEFSELSTDPVVVHRSTTEPVESKDLADAVENELATPAKEAATSVDEEPAYPATNSESDSDDDIDPDRFSSIAVEPDTDDD